MTDTDFVNAPATEIRAAYRAVIEALIAQGHNGPRWTDLGRATLDPEITDGAWGELQWDEVVVRDIAPGSYAEGYALARARAARKGVTPVWDPI